MKRKLEEEESRQKKKTVTQKFCRFGKTTLPLLENDDPRGFRPLENLPIDNQQKCLLDAIWRARNGKEKLDACCALQYYLNKIMEPPLGRNFSYYALLNGPKPGLYCYYSTLLSAKENVIQPYYKGFYSFTDALNFVWDNVHDKNSLIYVEEEPREGILIESYQVELKRLRGQVNDLLTEIAELKRPPTEDEELLTPTPEDEAKAWAEMDDDTEGRNPRNFR